jgi:hypothetical protein
MALVRADVSEALIMEALNSSALHATVCYFRFYSNVTATLITLGIFNCGYNMADLLTYL